MIECIFNCIKDAIKKINRFIIMNRLYHKDDEIARERQELISKKYQEGITSREEKRIKYLERQLDKIEDAKMGKYLDHLESMVVSRERIVKDIEVEAERIGTILEANLSMPIDAGKCALENADSLLNKYERKKMKRKWKISAITSGCVPADEVIEADTDTEAMKMAETCDFDWDEHQYEVCFYEVEEIEDEEIEDEEIEDED